MLAVPLTTGNQPIGTVLAPLTEQHVHALHFLTKICHSNPKMPATVKGDYHCFGGGISFPPPLHLWLFFSLSSMTNTCSLLSLRLSSVLTDNVRSQRRAFHLNPLNYHLKILLGVLPDVRSNSLVGQASWTHRSCLPLPVHLLTENILFLSNFRFLGLKLHRLGHFKITYGNITFLILTKHCF